MCEVASENGRGGREAAGNGATSRSVKAFYQRLLVALETLRKEIIRVKH